MPLGRIVMSLHGIRTRGVWQKDLAPLLAKEEFIPYPLDYGRFSAFKFLLPWSRKKKVDWLRREYERVVGNERVKRPSIIAHSFGTYLVGRLLEKYQTITFDKVIFAGSILNEDYDWPGVLQRGQVNLIRNDFGNLDWWPRVAKHLASGTGDSGTSGFTSTHAALTNVRFEHYGHSDYFNPTHFSGHWIPTLKRVFINDTDAKPFVEMMNLAVLAVGRRLGIPQDNLRANIFTPDEAGRLSIPPRLNYNMTNERELAISIPIGAGCTGRAYAEGKPAIAILGQDWGRDVLPDEELARVDPRLRWIVSSPIPDPDDDRRLLGIFNVDCLEVTSTHEVLSTLLDDLAFVARGLARRLRELG